MVGLLEEALDRRLLAHQGNHDVAVIRGLLRTHHDQVTLEDPDILHRLSANAQQILAVFTTRERRSLDVLLDVLLREYRLAGGDLPNYWQSRLDEASHSGRGAVEPFDCAGLGRIAP